MADKIKLSRNAKLSDGRYGSLGFDVGIETEVRESETYDEAIERANDIVTSLAEDEMKLIEEELENG